MQSSVPGQSDQIASHRMTAGEAASASRHSLAGSHIQQDNLIGGSRPSVLASDMHHRQAWGSKQNPTGPELDVTSADESVYADEASLPSFAQMAAAQGQRPLEQMQQSSNGVLSNNRQVLRTVDCCGHSVIKLFCNAHHANIELLIELIKWSCNANHANSQLPNLLRGADSE